MAETNRPTVSASGRALASALAICQSESRSISRTETTLSVVDVVPRSRLRAAARRSNCRTTTLDESGRNDARV
jgi:hypothetical protein